MKFFMFIFFMFQWMIFSVQAMNKDEYEEKKQFKAYALPAEVNLREGDVELHSDTYPFLSTYKIDKTYKNKQLKEILKNYNLVEIENPSLSKVERRFMTQEFIEVTAGKWVTLTNSLKTLYTDDVQDCIGISVWHSESKTAALYHAFNTSKFTGNHLENEKNKLFNFIEELNKTIKTPSTAVVNFVSSYWSPHVIMALNFMHEKKFKVGGIKICDAIIEHKLTEGNIEINEYIVEENKTPRAGMVLKADTGAVEFWRY